MSGEIDFVSVYGYQTASSIGSNSVPTLSPVIDTPAPTA